MEVEVIRSARRVKTVSARLEDEKLVVRAPAGISEEELQPLIAQLRERIERKVERRELSDETLETRAQMLNRRYFKGRLHWRSIRWVTNQQKRYGSCETVGGTIRLSHRLGKLPQWVQDYVIVHELAHLEQPNHGPQFWKLVNRYPLTERARGYLMALDLEDAGPDTGPG